MDHKRLSTGDILDFGILERTPPKSMCPVDAVLAEVDESQFDDDSLRAGLIAGGLEASMYYGVWKIWKDGDGFSGELMQYRVVTETLAKVSLADAVEHAYEWATNCYG